MQNIKARIFIQGDLIVYGYGGFYQNPKGWGLDIAYFRRSDLRGFGARRRVEKFILARVDALVKTGRAQEQFLPKFMAHLAHICEYEWEYEKSRVLFEYCRAKYGPFKRYNDFNQFAAECLGASYGMHPAQLFEIVKERTSSVLKVEVEEVLNSQKMLVARHAADVVKRVLESSFGLSDGLFLFQKVKEESGGKLSLILDGSEENYLVSKAFKKLIIDFYKNRMAAYTTAEYVKKAVRALKVQKNKDKRIPKARRDTIRALKQLRPEVRQLLDVLRMPVFIAIDENANFFRNFFNTIPLFVAKQMDELQEFQVFGLCMYQPYYQGGVIMTHGGREYPRFWHTVAEEVTHLADGPTDRMSLKGHHRYSGTKGFSEAYEKDRELNPPWKQGGKLGVKQWAQAMTLKRIDRLTRWRAQRRIAAFEATMEFDHYLPSQRNAEVFAALAVVERAAGRAVARKIMPNLFRYYEKVYLKGLRAEVRDLKKRVK